MSKTGRPNKEFNKDEFEKLCGIMCTQNEICSFFNTTDKTIANWCKRTYKLSFSDCIKKYSSQGKISLRRAQYKSAIRGNVTMQVWLGKQWLGQRDSVEVTDERLNKIDTLIGSIDELAKK